VISMKHKSFKGKARGCDPGQSIHYEAEGLMLLITLLVKVVLTLVGTIELTLRIRRIR
jgi:hypothetical protein